MFSDQSPLLSRPFRFYLHRDKINVGLGLLFLLATNSLDALLPLLIGRAIDHLAQSWDIRNLSSTLTLLAALTVGLSVSRYYWRIFWSRFHHSVAEHLRNQIFQKITSLGPSSFQKTTIGELMSLINNDVNSFRMAIGPGILILFDSIFLLFVVPPIMFSISISWALKTMVLMPLIPFIVYRLLNVIHLRFKNQQDRFGEMSAVTQEIIAGVRVIKSYAQEKYRTHVYDQSSQSYETACNRVAKADAVFTPSLEWPVGVGSVILLLVGAPEVINGHVSIGEFFAFYQYIRRMEWPMTALGLSLNFIQKGRASFARIKNLMLSRPDVEDSGTVDPDGFQELECRNLNFRYPESHQPVLQDISFKIPKGSVTAIIGKTGAGKSTLVDLICRFYPVPPGTLLLNGQSIERFKIHRLRSLFSVVPQIPFLFSRKIVENIFYGQQHLEAVDVEDLLMLVNLEQEVSSLPDSYNSFVGERGVNLSGGQKQRLTLARALARSAPFLILDDSLSAVDRVTEQSLLQVIRGRQRDHRQTTLIVSNRIASIQWADHIIVMDQGKIEAQGRHEEVLARSSIYRELYHLQKGEADVHVE